MVEEYNYINIKEILSRVLRHPLLQDVNIEQAVQYIIDFIHIFGMPKMFTDKQEMVDIYDFRGILPCDIVSIIQVKDCKTGICLRSMTDSFNPEEVKNHRGRVPDELTFKTQNRIIFTSFKEGKVNVAYKATPVDNDGFPMLIDNPVFLKALELYIKKEVFTILFDMGKISANVLQNTLQQYSWAAGQCQEEFSIPSTSEMESISRMWTTLIQRNTDFDKGFKRLGDREYIRVQ
jgi:hypothetical protein